MSAPAEIAPAPRCPGCGAELRWQHAQGAAPPAPRAGDFSLCDHCGEVLRFTPALELRRLTDADAADMDDELRRNLVQAGRRIRGDRREMIL